jgi:hypothetical protein
MASVSVIREKIRCIEEPGEASVVSTVLWLEELNRVETTSALAQLEAELEVLQRLEENEKDKRWIKAQRLHCSLVRHYYQSIASRTDSSVWLELVCNKLKR